jgi:NADH dehydrogenase
MSQLVTIFGGSGFVGRYIARRMAKQGWRVRVAVRRPNEALFVKSYGAVRASRTCFLQYSAMMAA